MRNQLYYQHIFLNPNSDYNYYAATQEE